MEFLRDVEHKGIGGVGRNRERALGSCLLFICLCRTFERRRSLLSASCWASSAAAFCVFASFALSSAAMRCWSASVFAAIATALCATASFFASMASFLCENAQAASPAIARVTMNDAAIVMRLRRVSRARRAASAVSAAAMNPRSGSPRSSPNRFSNCCPLASSGAES